MDFEEFKGIVLVEPDAAVVERYVFAGAPHVFGEWPEGLGVVRTHLNGELGCSHDNVVIVGSAKLGFSLSPDRFGRRFSDGSDVDVAVVDAALFDEIWYTVLKWDYPRRRIGSSEWAAARRREMFSGWCAPAELTFVGLEFPELLVPVRDLSAKWFNAFHSLSLHPRLAAREFNGRLYRTWDHAALYHADGIRQLRRALESAHSH